MGNVDKIKGYFTKEIQEQISGMSNEDMKTILKGIEGTPIWFAMLKYSQDRIAIIQSSFLTLDPVQEPAKIARYQGAVTGILDLQDAILALKFKSKQAEDPKNKEEERKNELGGAYGVV